MKLGDVPVIVTKHTGRRSLLSLNGMPRLDTVLSKRSVPFARVGTPICELTSSLESQVGGTHPDTGTVSIKESDDGCDNSYVPS